MIAYGRSNFEVKGRAQLSHLGISHQEQLRAGSASSHGRGWSVALGNGLKFDQRKPTRKEVDISSKAQKAGYGTRKIN